MASYEPPTATYPIFDSLAFQTPNSASITIAEADIRYLARNNIATSNASLTTFAGDISVGNSTLDYASGTGLTIKTTTNSESIFANVLNGLGATKLKIELNPNHTHLYDAVRFTDSGTPSNYTLFQQSTTTLNIDNVVASSTINFKTTSSAPASVTSLSLSSTEITANLPLTLGYTTTPAAGQLGFRLKTNGTLANTAMVSTTFYNFLTAGLSIPIGVWIVEFFVQATATAVAGSVTSLFTGLSTAVGAFTGGTGSVQLLGTQNYPAVAGTISGRATTTFQNTAVTTYYFPVQLTFGATAATTSAANSFFTITRIA
jgi:hypothetical protein